MKTIRSHSTVFLAVALALAPFRSAHADETTSLITFSDPSKPGTLKIRVWQGDVSIHGADVKEISVKSESTPTGPTPRKDGMRVLSATSGYVLSEKDNVVTLEYGAGGWTGGSADFDITVPSTTSVIVSDSAHGDIECSGVSGDVDVRTMSGDVKLSAVSGGACVETMNGDIGVNVKSLTESRPLSFTSMNGQITIHLPRDSKANIRFRTHRGVILTNFDDKVLVTKTEVSRSTRHRAEKPSPPEKPAAPSAGQDSADVGAPKQGVAEGDWHAEVRDSIREAAEEAAIAAREAAEAVHEGMQEFHAQISGTIPPLPPMTGGKVVAGALNGGGVEIQAATLNGDIVLKKAE